MEKYDLGFANHEKECNVYEVTKMHYVIGDVHGCYDELAALLTIIERKDKEARFILLGDLIDRGPKVWEVLYWAQKHISLNGKYQCIRGNHEQLALTWYVADYLPWYEEQGFYFPKEPVPETYYDFAEVLEKKGIREKGKIEPIMQLFEKLPSSKKITVTSEWGKEVTYRLVHAWYDYEETNEGKQFYINLEKRCDYINENPDEIIIHGHTCTVDQEYISQDEKPDRPGMIAYRKNSINLDGGCCFSKRFDYPCMLCAICLETLEEIYPDTLENRFYKNADKLISMEEAKKRADAYRDKYMKKENPHRKEMLKMLQGSKKREKKVKQNEAKL